MLELGDRVLGGADLLLWISPPGHSIKRDAVLWCRLKYAANADSLEFSAAQTCDKRSALSLQ
jgi:hypothetical protein